MSALQSNFKDLQGKLAAEVHKTSALVGTVASAGTSLHRHVNKLNTSVTQIKAGAPAPEVSTAALTLEQKVDMILAESLEQKAIIGRLNYTLAMELQKLQTQHESTTNAVNANHSDVVKQIAWVGTLIDVLDVNTTASNTNTGNMLTNLFKKKNKAAVPAIVLEAPVDDATPAAADADATPAPADADATPAPADADVAPLA
jgi:hypothetical protein